MYTICFTGHRPNKLGGYDWNTPVNQRIIQRLREVILEAIVANKDEGTIQFIFGGALGVDQMAFEVVQGLKINEASSIEIISMLAMPFEKQADAWFSSRDKERLKHQRKVADEVVMVDTLPGYTNPCVAIGEYHVAKMDARNRYMVDKSDMVIAVWDGSAGGTANCVNYASRKHKPIRTIF